MKVSDYIVCYLIEKGITDVFGYPGGMVTHLMDSFSKYKNDITSHVTYHEQGAAFAACGYAQASGNFGVAYATSGPGATNLITGICNAYFDSIPVLFITGQVNTFEARGNLGVRQRGFQETEIVSMVRNVTKYATYVETPEKIKYYLDYAIDQAMQGRKGPVLLDIPMNIFRADIDLDKLISCHSNGLKQFIIDTAIKQQIEDALTKAERPVLLIGNGIKGMDNIDTIKEILRDIRIPMVSTMLSVDLIDYNGLNYGFVGAYGKRSANFIVAKSDLVITIGARLDVRQVGAKRENFAPQAQIIRVDIDQEELAYKVHNDEIGINIDGLAVLKLIHEYKCDFENWISICDEIKQTTVQMDEKLPNRLMGAISSVIPDNSIITTDVGQNQVWAAQSFKLRENQVIFSSGGHGAMGYSLPAAIGCACATGKHIYCICGDGGIQMNIQELQFIVREKLPITIILFNNYALGMIRHFQEMYFEDNYTQTTPDGGYTVPDFEKIATAYGMKYSAITCEEDVDSELFQGIEPQFIEVKILENTYVFPKLEFGKPNQDQEPLMDREVYNYLMKL